MSVQNVVTRDTQKNITRWINAAAEQHGFDAEGFLGGLIAESGLDELSKREKNWPDVSYGLAHPAVKWMGQEVVMLQRAADGTVLDTPQNRLIARDYMWDAARAIQYAAPRYKALLDRWGDPLEAWCRYNKPNIPGVENPNRANYERGLAKAKEYAAVSADDGVDASNEIKSKLHAVGDYAIMASEFIRVSADPEAPQAEKVHGTKGYYISSPTDGWVLRGPFGQAE
jgi:hypothetical protein